MKRLIVLLAVLAMIASVATASLADKAANPQVWYTFDNTSGHVVTDSSGNGYDGQIKGSDFAHPSYPRTDPTWDYLYHPDDWSDTQPERFTGWQADGAIGGCLSNNYLNRCMYVDVPTAALASIGQKGTISWWADRPDTSEFGIANGGFFRSSAMMGTTAPYVTISGYPTRGENSLTFNIGDLDGRFWGGYSNVAIGEWNHFALVFDADAGYEALYLNGKVVFSAPNTNGIAGMEWFHLFTGNGALDPAATWATTSFFHGRMDDFRMYDTALTSAEVMELVPEPTTIALLSLGSLALIRKRKA